MSQQEGSIAHSHQTREESTYRYRPSLVCRIVASVTVLSACSSLSACRYSGEQDAPTKVVTRIMCYGFGCEMVGASSERHHFLKCHFLPPASGRSWPRYPRRPRRSAVQWRPSLARDRPSSHFARSSTARPRRGWKSARGAGVRRSNSNPHLI